MSGQAWVHRTTIDAQPADIGAFNQGNQPIQFGPSSTWAFTNGQSVRVDVYLSGAHNQSGALFKNYLVDRQTKTASP